MVRSTHPVLVATVHTMGQLLPKVQKIAKHLEIRGEKAMDSHHQVPDLICRSCDSFLLLTQAKVTTLVANVTEHRDECENLKRFMVRYYEIPRGNLEVRLL